MQGAYARPPPPLSLPPSPHPTPLSPHPAFCTLLQAYVTNLNGLVAADPALAGKSLVELVRTAGPGPVFNNAAQVCPGPATARSVGLCLLLSPPLSFSLYAPPPPPPK